MNPREARKNPKWMNPPDRDLKEMPGEFYNEELEKEMVLPEYWKHRKEEKKHDKRRHSKSY